jgi:hypothetical protein
MPVLPGSAESTSWLSGSSEGPGLLTICTTAFLSVGESGSPTTTAGDSTTPGDEGRYVATGATLSRVGGSLTCPMKTVTLPAAGPLSPSSKL